MILLIENQINGSKIWHTSKAKGIPNLLQFSLVNIRLIFEFVSNSHFSHFKHPQILLYEKAKIEKKSKKNSFVKFNEKAKCKFQFYENVILCRFQFYSDLHSEYMNWFLKVKWITMSLWKVTHTPLKVIYCAWLVTNYAILHTAHLSVLFLCCAWMGIVTLKSCTPITANMNCRRYVTNIMLKIVPMATITHFTTYFYFCCCDLVRITKVDRQVETWKRKYFDRLILIFLCVLQADAGCWSRGSKVESDNIANGCYFFFCIRLVGQAVL